MVYKAQKIMIIYFITIFLSIFGYFVNTIETPLDDFENPKVCNN